RKEDSRRPEAIEHWPEWVSFRAASRVLGVSVKTVSGWTKAVQAPTHQSGTWPLISAEWVRELIRNRGTLIPKAYIGLLLPVEIASRYGLPEVVAVHLLRHGLIQSKQIRGVFEYRLRSVSVADPKAVVAYLADRNVTFDLRKTPLVAEQEIRAM